MLENIYKITIDSKSPYIYKGITKRIKYNEDNTEYILNTKTGKKVDTVEKDDMKIEFFKCNTPPLKVGGSTNDVQVDVCFTFDYIYDKIKDFFSRDIDYTFSFKQFLKENGNIKIETLKVFKTPISSLLNKMVNYVIKDKSIIYDELYHTGLLINDKYIIEKNESISFRNFKKNNKTFYHDISLDKELTINQLLENTKSRLDTKEYFTYHALNHNCQMFVKQLLTHNSLITDDLLKFFYQDIEEIKERLKDSDIMNNATSLTDFFTLMKSKIFKGNKINNVGKGKVNAIKKDVKRTKKLVVIKQDDIEKVKELEKNNNQLMDKDVIYSFE